MVEFGEPPVKVDSGAFHHQIGSTPNILSQAEERVGQKFYLNKSARLPGFVKKQRVFRARFETSL